MAWGGACLVQWALALIWATGSDLTQFTPHGMVTNLKAHRPDDKQNSADEIMILQRFFHAIFGFFVTTIVFIAASAQVQAQPQRDGLFDAIQFIAQSVPTRMDPGQNVDIEIKIKNVGTTTWSNKARYSLVVATPAPGLSWGAERVELGADEFIKPGETKTFSLRIVAPTSPATYPFEWYFYHNADRLYKDVLAKANIVVVDPLNGAQFVSQLMPDKIELGSEPRVFVQFKNTGKTSWSAKNGYRLGLINAAKSWQKTNVDQSETTVPPGEIATFAFTLNAPTIPGKYLFQSQMLSDNNVFGELSPPVIVSVANLTVQGLQATVSSQTVPKVMTARGTYEVKVMMKNTGSTVWTATDYKLGAQNPEDNLIWLINRVELEPQDIIRPGQSKQFVFTISAPCEPGNHPFQWQMLSDKYGYFGDRSENILVNVKPRN